MTVQPPFGRRVRPENEKSRRKAAFLLHSGTFANDISNFSDCFWAYSPVFIIFFIPAGFFRRVFSFFYETKAWKMTAEKAQNC